MEEEKKEEKKEEIQPPVQSQVVEEKKSKKGVVIVILSVIIVCLIGLCVYLLFFKDKDDNNNNNTNNNTNEKTNNNTNENTNENETKPIDPDDKNYDVVINLDTIDTTKKLSVRKFEPKEMKVLTANKNRKFGSGSVVDIKIDGTTVDIVYTIDEDTKYTRKYQNINKIYYYEDNDCADYLFLFLMSDEFIEPALFGVSYNDELSLHMKESMNNGYEKLYYDFVSGSPCGASYLEYGYKDGKYYNIYSNEAYVDNTYHFFDGLHYIKVDRTYSILGHTGTAKLIINDLVAETPDAIIDSNNKLVYFGETLPEGVKQEEVSKVMYNKNSEYQDIYLKYKDGSVAKISYVTVEY